MQFAKLGPFEHVSRLTLGGGGLGQLWGETSQDEAIETVHAALSAGINFLDTAPMYRACESVIAEAFAGRLPEGVRITTKCQLGEPLPGAVADMLETSLDSSLEAMRLERVDVFFLHSNICEDDTVYARWNERRAQFATPWSMYLREVIPAMERLRESGRMAAWGITGTGLPGTIIRALEHEVKPALVQVVTNLLDSAGSMRAYAEPARPHDILAAAVAQGVGVMGIRAVQAGALTDAIDRTLKDSHPEAEDFRRAEPFRELCARHGLTPAAIAHRYALSMSGVDTVILGVKNRDELTECLNAEAEGPLSDDLLRQIADMRFASL